MLCIFVFGSLMVYTSSQPIILGACTDEEFECDDGVCIPIAWQCDYEIDCANKEDELYDINGDECVSCAERGFFCEDESNKCIPPQWHCDGWTDCKNGNDEQYCTPCSDEQFTCSNGQCIDINLLCDSNEDCPKGEDELDCIYSTHAACPFRCDSDALCIRTDQLCDGHFDCEDKTDECDDTLCSDHIKPTECDIISPTTTTTNTTAITRTPTISTMAIDHVPTWKYCPSEIVWLGFVDTFKSDDNTTAVYWIEPKVREEGIYYEKYSTSYNSGDYFGVGLYSVQYIAKKRSASAVNSTSANDMDVDETDDPIFCIVRVLVLDGMRDYSIADCEAQTPNGYLEWEFVVDDDSYNIAYFTMGAYEADIKHARFVPMTDKFYTDCYAQIAFETGILKSEEEVVIEQTVHWMASHLYALIGFVVGVVLLFCILLIVIIILWRKHVEMREFIRADTSDHDGDEYSNDESMEDGEHVQMLDTKRPSTIDLEVTTPGGLEYANRTRDSIPSNQMPYITSSQSSYAAYNLGHLNVENVSDASDSDEDNDENDLYPLKLKKGNEKAPRRPSILGINYDQLKQIQQHARKEKRDRDADVLMENEWEKGSERSQGL